MRLKFINRRTAASLLRWILGFVRFRGKCIWQHQRVSAGYIYLRGHSATISSYEVEERAPYLGETRAWIGDATWKPLDRASVEVLVDSKVWPSLPSRLILFASWNLRYCCSEAAHRRVDLLLGLERNVITLREVSRRAWEVIDAS